MKSNPNRGGPPGQTDEDGWRGGNKPLIAASHHQVFVFAFVFVFVFALDMHLIFVTFETHCSTDYNFDRASSKFSLTRKILKSF